MKKLTKAEQECKDLFRLAKTSKPDEVAAALNKALSGSSSLIVSKAADIAGAMQLQECSDQLVESCRKFTSQKSGKQFGVRASILRALNGLEYMDGEIFAEAAKCYQPESGRGSDVDSAGDVRVEACFGLARTNHPQAHYLLAELLLDKLRSVRFAAVRALRYLGTPEAEIMLRLRVLIGDEVEIMSECFEALLTMIERESLGFVAGFLNDDSPAVAESAALAIGSCRSEPALQVLIDQWDKTADAQSRRVLLVPISMTRLDSAGRFLVEALRSADLQTATRALELLELMVNDQVVADIVAALKDRAEPKLEERFRQSFVHYADLLD